MQPIVLITRPEPAALEFADRLRARLGCDTRVVLSPLMRIEATGELPDLDRYRGLIFTSRNGVEVFAARTRRRDLPCYCVGDATARLARDRGFNARSAAGDAEALIGMLRDSAGNGPLLHLRGAHSRGDIAARLGADEVVIYRQIAQPLNDVAQQVLSGEAPVVLPLFSPRSASLFFSGGETQAPLRIAAMSLNVADAVPDGAALQVAIAQNPDAEAMLDTVEALLGSGKSLEGGNPSQ